MSARETSPRPSLNPTEYREDRDDEVQIAELCFESYFRKPQVDAQIGNSLPNSPSPNLLSIPGTSQRGFQTESTDSVSNGSKKGSHESALGDLTATKIGNGNVQYSAKTREQSLNPTLAIHTSPSLASSNNHSRSASPFRNLKRELEHLQTSQEAINYHVEGPPRLPELSDFPPSIMMRILDPIIDVPIRHCIIMLHHHGNNEKTMNTLAKRLQQEQRESAFLLLRGLQAIPGGNSGYHWADPERGSDETFLDVSRVVLLDIIKNGLIAKCRFQPREIIVLGHCQGGMAALAIAASWSQIEFGGAVSVGGPIPTYTELQLGVKAKTPALILGGTLGDITPTALQQIRTNFTYVDSDIRRDTHDEIPDAAGIKPLLEFFAHRLRREEWTKQAVVSFDGGGIRGYGSLLILKDLMDKIGDEEKRQEPTSESSFAPFAYKPKSEKPVAGDSGSLKSQSSNPSDATHPLAFAERPHTSCTESHDLHHSPFFLPCHYFTYAAGTSTGGLISIMLSRFRMTVDDCLKEYKIMGDKIFGNPRPMSKGAVLWHKYDHRALRSAVEEITRKYSETSKFSVNYPLHEDVCKWYDTANQFDRTIADVWFRSIVLAIADFTGADAPWLFRTYGTSEPPPHPNGGPADRTNYGEAANIPIWQVARATSAAPRYFPPIKIQRGNEPGFLRFKDGGFGFNNPSHEVYKDVVNKHDGMHSQSMGPFISIGTGYSDLEMFSTRSGNLSNARSNLKAAFNLPSRTMNAHLKMLEVSYSDNKEVFPYYRFDGGERLGKIPLDEWKGNRFKWLTRKTSEPGYKTLEKMEVATAIYLKDRNVERRLQDCAKVLVRRRRLRARYLSEWDRYASFSYYECDLKGCQRSRIDKAAEFLDHLRNVHGMRLRDEVMEKKMSERRRIYWVYRQDGMPQHEREKPGCE